MSKWLEIEDVTESLTEPPDGTQKVSGHDRMYGEIRDGFDTVRDTCNSGIDKVNGWLGQAGLSDRLPKLTDKSLDEYVVFPLSGNYYRIQQNGAACGILRKGMGAWGKNFRTLGANSVLAFEGQANLAFAGQLVVYEAVMNGVGAVVSAGSTVFDSIATVSERIAVKVEQALIEMGKRLLKLAKVVSKRFLGGWASAALLIKDLAEHGISVITDVVDDVKWCIEQIDKCFELKDEIETWAQTQADRLEAFKEIASIISQLPSVDLTVPLEDFEIPDFSAVQDAIKDLDPDFGQSEEGSEAEDSVDDATEGLAAENGYVHPSWAEACVVPPLGMGQYPYDPSNPEGVALDPLTGQVIEGMPEEMIPPNPGVSSSGYYRLYEEWRQQLEPPRYAPPAKGQPAGV